MMRYQDKKVFSMSTWNVCPTISQSLNCVIIQVWMGCSDGCIRIFNASGTTRMNLVSAHPTSIRLLAGCPVCVWSTCSTQNTICMRSLADGSTRLRLFGHTQPVTSFAVVTIPSSDSKYQLWSSAGDGMLVAYSCLARAHSLCIMASIYA